MNAIKSNLADRDKVEVRYTEKPKKVVAENYSFHTTIGDKTSISNKKVVRSLLSTTEKEEVYKARREVLIQVLSIVPHLPDLVTFLLSHLHNSTTQAPTCALYKRAKDRFVELVETIVITIIAVIVNGRVRTTDKEVEVFYILV